MAPPPTSLTSAPLGEMAPGLGTSAYGAFEAEEARLRRQAFLAVLLSAFCIGFSPIFVRLADTGPAAIGFWRLFFALGPMALWAYAEHRTALRRARLASLTATESGAAAPAFRPLTRRQFAFTFLAGLLFCADLILYHAGLALTTTANGVLLGNLAVVFTLTLGWLCLGERPTRGLFLAMLLALTGTAIIISRSGASGAIGSGSVLGDLFCVFSAASYAGFMLFVRKLRRRGPEGAPGMPGGLVALLSTFWGMVLCLAWAIASGETLIPQSLQGLLAVAGLGIVSHSIGQGLTTFALGRLPAGVISVVQLLQVLLGVLLAALLFSEIPSAAVFVGGAFIITGVLAARPR